MKRSKKNQLAPIRAFLIRFFDGKTEKGMKHQTTTAKIKGVFGQAGRTALRQMEREGLITGTREYDRNGSVQILYKKAKVKRGAKK